MNAPSPEVQAFVSCFATHPVTSLIRNLSTRVEALDIHGQDFPITINDGGLRGNCYICNPVTGYRDYAIEETRNFAATPSLRRLLIGLIHLAGPLVAATGLDRAVHVNNWLFSTNPAPLIDRGIAAMIRDRLCARFPTHAIILRSLNTYADQPAIDALQAEGFQLLPSRQIYLFDGRAPRPLSKDMKNDRALLRRTHFTQVRNDDFLPTDYARCAELYDLLYLQKYTPLNPQYTAAFIEQMHQRGVIQLEGLRDEDGRLAAIGGRFQYRQTLTQPLLGYDTTRPQRDGLYRLITAMAQRDAIANGLLFNMSAGAAGFKRSRNAFAAIEYSAVYTRHLGQGQQWATRTLGGLLRKIGIALLERYEL